MPSNATIDSSSISFSHLRTQWNTAGFHSATAYGGTGTDPGTSNISLSEFRGAVTGFNKGSITESVPNSGELSINDDFKGKTFYAA
jgi:hypothetical protein